MRILAIRGANLASLAGEFEVDLAAEPLASAGLFAITGATGAGKSTLLDAMCAALFDRTPRLEGRSRFEVGRGDRTVGAFDVRSLLRRTASHGWAEVDFEGRDRRPYRARWSVHRARRDPGGALRDQQMTLVRTDDNARLGGTRSETQRAIEQALGLTFDQFRRSALLAQGDFAAFLRADGSQRAALLERMTGTALYGELSKEAHRRAVAFAHDRKLVLAKLEAAAILDEQDRAALVRAEADAAAALARARADERALAAAAAWRARMQAARAAVARGVREAEAAAAARADAEPRAAALALADRIAPLREPWTRWRDAVERAEAAREAAIAAATDVIAIEARDRAARAARAAARAALQAAVAERTASEAELVEARRLDDAIAAAGKTVDATRAAAAAAGARLDAHQARLDAALGAIAEAEAERAEAGGELARLDAIAAVSAEWPRLDETLAEIARGAAALAAARARVDELTPAIHEGERAIADGEAARDRADAALRAARARHDEADALARASGEPAAQQRLDDAEQRRNRARALAVLTARARETTRAWRVALTDASAARALVDEAERERAIGDDTARELGAALREAEATALRLRTAAGYDAARADLVEGEACPLCGATEHPLGHAPIADAMIRDQDARVRGLREQVGAVRAQLDKLAIEIGAARLRAHDRAADAERANGQRTRDAIEWRAGVAELGELPLIAAPDADDARAWIDELCGAGERELAAARAERDRARAIARAAADAHARVLAAAHELEQIRGQLDRDHARLDGLRAERTTAERERDLAGHGLAAARATARAIVPAPLHPRLDEPGLAGELATAVATWRAARTRADDADQRLARHRAAAAALREGATDVATAADDARAEADRAAADRAALVAARAPLLDGVATGERIAALDAVVAEADHQARFADRDADDAATARTAADTRSLAAAEAARTAEQVARAAHAAVAAGLERLGLDPDAAAAALALAPEQLAADRAELAALERAVAATRAGLAELQAQVAALAGERPAGFAEGDDVDERLQAAAAAVAAAAERATDLGLRRRADDDARVRHRAAAGERDQLELRAAPFERLDELIGSADGKGLRDFAQSLTLEALLGAANHHLDELAPRYQLERVPARDLELQVIDREMGDEIRSLASLSGGETFLASLALALGLSSLSAGGITVRTLLVDEGFGTLDPHTLDVALAALDALRATGRQVGIVSHVPGLEERVGATVEVRAVGGGKSVVTVR